MVKSPAKIIGFHRRQLQAATLTLLWALYSLLGMSSLCARAAVHDLAPPSRTAVSAAASAPVCHCKMCHGMMRDGKMVCCCCGKAPRTPLQQAVITARCDSGAPAVLAAVTSWPVVQPGLTAAVSLCLAGRRFDRPGDTLAFSLSHLPLTPPPSFL